jgi:hypothetical protein
MPKAVVVLGLCGSGKSHLIEARGLRLFDGPIGTPSILDDAIAWLRSGRDCGLEEIHYCIPSYREAFERRLRAEVPGVEIEWVCFANDLDAANWNVTHRQNKADAETHRGINGQLHPKYVCPAGVPILPIHRVPPPEQ